MFWGVRNLSKTNTPASTSPGREDDELYPCYTFSAWDKSQYDVTVRTPERLQWGTIVTAIALIIFAAVQVWIAL